MFLESWEINVLSVDLKFEHTVLFSFNEMLDAVSAAIW